MPEDARQANTEGFTAIFVRRPVLAIVLSLLLIVLGVMSFEQLPLRVFGLSHLLVVEKIARTT